MATALQLPRWDMTPIFPGLESPEFQDASRSVIVGIDRLAELFDGHGVQARKNVASDDNLARTFEAVMSAYIALGERMSTLGAYIRSFVTTDSRNAMAQAKASELQQQSVRFSQLGTRFTAWIGSLDVESLIERSELARDHTFMLRKTKTSAEHLMSPDEENLAAELHPSGGSAWSRLHSDLSSQIMVSIELSGEQQTVPMTVIRNLAYDSDRDTRKRAHEAEIRGWTSVTVPMAAALNSIKGEVNMLSARRGWDSPLDAALFQNNIDRQTLDAMMEAARAAFPDFRRYMRAKAHAIGVPALAWYDLFAPVGRSSSVWDYDTGTAFLLEQFGTYSDRLRDFAARAFAENWIDAEPRPGKVGGAFCMAVQPGVSRILGNYTPTYDGVSMLAHELGHAYHGFNLMDRDILQRANPMTLAETASIFCETIIEHAAMARADREEQIALLEASIQGHCQLVVDISSRFLFETAVFEARQKRDLSVDEFCDLMLDAQRQTYGDGLDSAVLHAYMWTAKSHYYSTGRSFYNYPYMFGLLFGLGLYARYQQDPVAFKAGYDELLSATGLADAATLASRFDIDIRTPEFWTSSLDIIRRNIDRFVQLVT